jgi:hypothetical protein
MAAKIQKSSDLGKIWFPSRLLCCELISNIWFAMAVILNPKWPPKYKNPPIWGKFGYQVDFFSCELIFVIVFGIGSH